MNPTSGFLNSIFSVDRQVLPAYHWNASRMTESTLYGEEESMQAARHKLPDQITHQDK